MSGKIPHVLDQLSLRVATFEASTLESVLYKNKSQAMAMRSPCTTMKSRPLWLQLEKPVCSNEDPAQPKILKRKKGSKKGRKEEKEPSGFQHLTLSSRFLGSLLSKMKLFRVLHVKVVL